jgi:hypothetical protein
MKSTSGLLISPESILRKIKRLSSSMLLTMELLIIGDGSLTTTERTRSDTFFQLCMLRKSSRALEDLFLCSSSFLTSTMHYEALTEEGRKVFPYLKDFKDFYLAGGTALALQLGHRVSVDFGFCRIRNLGQTTFENHEVVSHKKNFSLCEQFRWAYCLSRWGQDHLSSISFSAFLSISSGGRSPLAFSSRYCRHQGIHHRPPR